MVDSSFNNDYYEDEGDKKSTIEKVKVSLGAISLTFSVLIFLSLTSYLFTGHLDQSLIDSGLSFSALGEKSENWLGVFGAFLSHYLVFVTFGISSFFLVPFLLVISLRLLFNFKIYSIPKTSIFTFFGIFWLSTILGYFLNLFPESSFLKSFTGGIGVNLSLFLNNLLGVSSIIILLLFLFLFLVFYFNIYSFDIPKWKKKTIDDELENTFVDDFEEDSIESENEEDIEESENYKEELKEDIEEENKSELKDADVVEDDDNEDSNLQLKVEKGVDEKKSKTLSSNVYDPELDLSNYKYPKVDLLNDTTDKKIQVSKDELTSNKNRIIETLKNFKIEIAKIKATIGPTVTLYEIVPEAGIKISKIKNLEDDIALSLSALGIRIIAPIPGKGTIGIEVPNKNRETVSLRSVMSTEKFIKCDYELPLILGKTISNEVFLADLTKMPHILVAGATGQGKSVGLNVMLSSLLYKKHPSILKFVLIDPKKVELSLFNKIEKHFLAKLPDAEAEEDSDLPRFAIVGRPNVGKSSFVNALVGEERNIVTDIAGTTRDSLDTHYTKFGHDFVLVDTAGVRKKKKVSEDLEFYSVMRSIRSIEYSDVCLLLIDATLGFESQDQSIFHLADKNRKGIVILVNKWDLVDKDTNTTKAYEAAIREKIAPFTDVPILFISALTKQRLLKALEIAIKVSEDRKARISTSKLNDVMLPFIEHNPPPATKGKYIRIKFCTQLPTKTPTFAFFANLPQYIKEPYKRYIENKLRESFNFSGVPLQIFFRKK